MLLLEKYFRRQLEAWVFNVNEEADLLWLSDKENGEKVEIAPLSQKQNGNPNICKICFLFYWDISGFEGLSHQDGATAMLQKKPCETFSVVYMSLQSDVSANHTELSD